MSLKSDSEPSNNVSIEEEVRGKIGDCLWGSYKFQKAGPSVGSGPGPSARHWLR